MDSHDEQCPALSAESIREAIDELQQAGRLQKCRRCARLHWACSAIPDATAASDRLGELRETLQQVRRQLLAIEHERDDCPDCYPANAQRALGLKIDASSTENIPKREGWTCLPGSYVVLRYHAPVAVCTLTDEALAEQIVELEEPAVSIVGTLQTENLGIERLIQNVLANPNIRFLLICGTDVRKPESHYPGGTLLALARHGIDPRLRIQHAPGRRPFLRNLSTQMVEHFRATVHVSSLMGVSSIESIRETILACAETNPGPAPKCLSQCRIKAEQGYLPRHMHADPRGYFIIYPDHARSLLLMEHYNTDGVLDVVIQGQTAAEIYVPAIEKKLISRLDHAAYLGRELARAEAAIRHNLTYVQDSAPELERR